MPEQVPVYLSSNDGSIFIVYPPERGDDTVKTNKMKTCSKMQAFTRKQCGTLTTFTSQKHCKISLRDVILGNFFKRQWTITQIKCAFHRLYMILESMACHVN